MTHRIWTTHRQPKPTCKESMYRVVEVSTGKCMMHFDTKQAAKLYRDAQRKLNIHCVVSRGLSHPAGPSLPNPDLKNL